MLFNNKYLSDDEEERADDEFSGFTIIDESGIDISELRRVVKEAEADEPTIATPVPENEKTVIIDNAAAFLPYPGTELLIEIANGAGSVYYNGSKVGDFKPAFMKLLHETRAGQYATAYMHSNDTPAMVKLLFSAETSSGAVLID